MAQGGGHAPYLPVTAFPQYQLDPDSRHALAETDRRGPGPETCWFRDEPCPGGQGGAVMQTDARTQSLQISFRGNAFHLYPISLRQLVARMADTLLQFAVIREYHQSFTIRIQAPGRIDVFYRNEVSEGGAAAITAELADDSMGFIKKDD